ncbi:CpaE family protein [Roseomonas sp. CCTCC AB2023176]|uniref:AAA family ATPase n=1 Tax=Roseomonas sp. CCTCC AB2023176 TaxID=3342640 RepID=UPI0035D9F8AC
MATRSLPARRGGTSHRRHRCAGGVGTTTVAINLALQLAEAGRAHVGILDLHLRGGTAGVMLGVRCGSGLRVALEDPQRVDALFLERSSVSVTDRVTLVGAEEPMDADPRPTELGVKRILSMLTARFNYVVVDVPHPPGLAERIVLEAAQQRLVVLGPDLVSVRDTLSLRRALATIGSGDVATVLNRVGLPGGIKPRLLEEGLGSAPDFVIPDLPRHLPRAAHLGRPAVRDSAALRRSLVPLLERAGASRPAAGRSLLGRLLGRKP